MKTVIISLASLLTFSTLVRSQTGWEWLNPTPQGNTLTSVHFYAPNKIVAVGEAGTLLRTSNDGTNWKVRHYIKDYKGTFTSVYFFNDIRGIATSINGLIFTKKDGGASWTQQVGQPSVKYNATSFPTPSTGYIFGDAGVILRSNDSGNTWKGLSLTWSGDLFGCSFTNSKTGTAVGTRATIIRTTDGGESWMAQTSTKSVPLFSVDFLNENFGVIGGGEGLIMKTTDAGKHWDSLSTPTRLGFFGVKVFSENEFLAVGGNHPYPNTSIVLKTTNGGKDWRVINLEMKIPTLYSLSFIDNECGCAVGGYGGIAYTSDRGETWDMQGSGFYSTLHGIKFTSPLIGYMVSQNGGLLFKTTDGGNTWNQSLIKAMLPPPLINPFVISSVRDHSFVNDRTAYLFIRASVTDLN